jgi:hypothetical protein
MSDPVAPAESEPQAAGAAAPTEHVADIPGRRPGVHYVLVLPDREIADAVRHLVRQYRRTQVLRQEREALERWREELLLIEEQLGLDPNGARTLAAIVAYEAQRGRRVARPDAAPSQPRRRVVAVRVSTTTTPGGTDGSR